MSLPNWFERHPRLTLGLLLLALLIIFELVIRVVASKGLVPISYYPESDQTKRFLGDINPDFGVWHYPNKETRHRHACFDVTYKSNSYGARDRERTRESSTNDRVIVLGDSFAEGAGVDVENRVSNILEEKTGREFLNFGTSGDFSSVQEWLLYENMAKKFDHSEVLLFFLPANDFRDNEPTNFSTKRYRPYLRKTKDNSGFELYYPVEFNRREIPKGLKPTTKIRRYFYNRIYLLNIIRNSSKFYRAFRDRFEQEVEGRDRALTHYLDYREIDIERLLFSYTRLVEAMDGKPLRIVIIPRLGDLRVLAETGIPPRLTLELQAFAQGYKNVEVLDLLPSFLESEGNFEDYFLACDGHWTPLGNQLAAEIIAEKFKR